MKRSKKMLAIIMSISMILTIVPIALFANANTGVDSFGEDNSGNYSITSAEDLMTLANNVNELGYTYDGCTFTLANDISLSGKTWAPIGFGSHTETDAENNTTTVKNVFKGSFNGNGKTISNIAFSDAVTTTTESGEKTTYTGGQIGLFGYVSGNATIENLIIKDSNFVISYQ